ncbi:esterase, partial [Streptococcus pyogenes]
YADFGMVEACKDLVEAGKIQFFTVTSIDKESWLADWKPMHDRALAHQAYEQYIINEAIPFIKHKTNWFDGMMATGCSM